ncbi:hypothetical protein [Streptomyces sp. NPDC014623]
MLYPLSYEGRDLPGRVSEGRVVTGGLGQLVSSSFVVVRPTTAASPLTV